MFSKASSSVSPSGHTDQALTSVRIVFNEALDPATLRASPITLRGSVTELDVAQALTFARAFPPAASNGLSFTFTAQRKSQGVLGVWQNSGQTGVSEIYSTILDVIFHEGVHQVTLANQNRQTTGAIGREVVAAAKQPGGGQIPSNCITRSYARTNDPEFMAEFFTGLRSLENGLQTRFTLGGGTFNPPENVRAIARRIWAEGAPQ